MPGQMTWVCEYRQWISSGPIEESPKRASHNADAHTHYTTQPVCTHGARLGLLKHLHAGQKLAGKDFWKEKGMLYIIPWNLQLGLILIYRFFLFIIIIIFFTILAKCSGKSSCNDFF